MGRTPIEWVRRNGEPGFSVNPIRFRNLETGRVGHYCEKISPGCKFCYADKLQMSGFYKLSGLPFRPESLPKGELFLDRGVLREVLGRRKPTAYFWCDMTDLFGHWVPFEWIDEIISTIVASSKDRHMILTKRPDVALEYFASGRHDGGRGPDRANYHLDDSAELKARGVDFVAGDRPDIWLGVSCEDRERKSRLELLRKIPADHRFVSFEPLLEDLELRPADLKGVDLAIWGGESGGKARDCSIDWIRYGMKTASAAGVMNFVKQLGRRPVERNYARSLVSIKLDNKKGGDMEEWPADVRVRELPE
jgi:protein gp37